MHSSNRTILEKADFALADLVSNGGLLLPAQAKKFMRLSTTESTLLGQVTYRPMNRPKEIIDQIKFGSRVLRAAQELTALPVADRTVPDLSKVELDAQEFIGEVNLSDRVLEENIEQGELRQTIMQLLAPAVGRDLEEAVINGDTGSVDPFLQQLDGIIVQAQTNVVDAVGAPVSKDLFHDMMKALPTRYRKNKRELRFYTASDAELDYRNTLAERATVAGDKYLETDTPVLAAGTPIVGVPLFPSTLGLSNDQTVVILTHPKNIVVGVRRKIRIEWERSIRQRAVAIVVTLEADTKFAEEEGVVKAINVQL
ncbi:MAG: phage major capsid protein [Deltaproteobacteria bacterium]|nr:phage major capsid protein [Deltaproteobacteria bacterium]